MVQMATKMKEAALLLQNLFHLNLRSYNLRIYHKLSSYPHQDNKQAYRDERPTTTQLHQRNPSHGY